MTLFEAIKSNSILSEILDSRIELAFTMRGINHRIVADESSLNYLELVTADLYKELAMNADFTEGDLTIKQKSKYLLDYVEKIAEKYEDEKLGFIVNEKEITDITDEW